MNSMIITAKSAIFVFSREGETLSDKDFMAMICEAYQQARSALIAANGRQVEEMDGFTASNGVLVQVVARG